MGKKNQTCQPVSDKQWQARDDAYALSRAKEIKTDPKRLLAASKAAKEIANEKAKELSSFKSIAKKTK